MESTIANTSPFDTIVFTSTIRVINYCPYRVYNGMMNEDQYKSYLSLSKAFPQAYDIYTVIQSVDDILQWHISYKTSMRQELSGILACVKISVQVVVVNDEFYHLHTGGMSDELYQRFQQLKSDYPTPEELDMYTITPIQMTWSIYKWTISYKTKMSPSEVTRYTKTKSTKDKRAEDKARENEEKIKLENARIESLRSEFIQWIDDVRTKHEAVLSHYVKLSTSYKESVDKKIDIGVLADKLLYFQVRPCKEIINALITNHTAIVAADTGLGKTYMTLAAIKYLGMKCCFICQKIAMTDVHRVAQYIGIEVDVFSYGMFKKADNKYIVSHRVKTTQIEFNKVMAEMRGKGWNPCVYKRDMKGVKIEIAAYAYTPTYLNNTIFVFDEAHQCKKESTLNGIMFKQLKIQGGYSAALSATILDNEEHIYNICDFLHITDELLRDNTRNGYITWTEKLVAQIRVPDKYNEVIKRYRDEEAITKYVETIKFNGKKVNVYKDNKVLQVLHRYILPFRGNRITIRSENLDFPDNLILAHSYSMEEVAGQINEEYAKMKKDIEAARDENIDNKVFNDLLVRHTNGLTSASERAELERLAAIRGYDIHMHKMLADHEAKSTSPHFLAIITRTRQRIELLKIPFIVAMTLQLLYEGNSVVIWCSYKETIRGLYEKLNKEHIIDDEKVRPRISMLYKDIDDKDKQMSDFQSNATNVMMATFESGGVSINLQDKDGRYPRVALYPLVPLKGIEFKQALGRIHRAGGKSKCRQMIICCANTIEEKLAQQLSKKLDNIDNINDGVMFHSLVFEN